MTASAGGGRVFATTSTQGLRQELPPMRLWHKAKKLGTDLNRDSLWKLLEPQGFEGVRLVSLDDTWSGMMFRRK